MTVRCSAENLCTLSLRPCFVQVSRCGVKVACELHNSSCRAWHHWNGNVRGHLSDEVDIWTAFVSIGTGKAARCGAQKALVAPTQCTHKTWLAPTKLALMGPPSEDHHPARIAPAGGRVAAGPAHA